MSTLLADLRFAMRMLWKHKALTASALATISLAIGANTAIFTLVSSVLLRPLPLPEPERLVRIEENHQGPVLNLTGATFVDLKERARAFSAVAAYRIGSPGLASGAVPEQVFAAEVSPGYFEVLGVAPALGRGFGDLDFAPGARRSVVLSDGVWRRSFGADQSVVGRTVLLNAVPTEVIGIMPEGFFAPGTPQVWVPQTPASALRLNRRAHLFAVIGRVRQGIALASAREELQAVSKSVASDSKGIDGDFSIVLTPLQARLVQPARLGLLVLWGAVALLLVIGATNVANLLLMQGTARAREISIRTALGAPRRRILRQFATEALVLGGAGGLFGTILGIWAVPALRLLLPAALPRTGDMTIGTDVLIFAVVLSLLTALLFGAAPALRSCTAAPVDALRDRHGDSPSHSWLRTIFVSAQVALTVVLLVGAGLLARSFLLVTRVNPGFDSSNTLAFDLSLPSAGYPDARAHAVFLSSVAEGVRSIPGVQAAGATGAVPLTGTASTTMVPEGGDPNAQLAADVIPVSAGLFEALRIPVIQGRPFSGRDTSTTLPVMLISQTAARTFWSDGRNPLGTRITMQDWGAPYTAEVIGVVGDVHQAAPDAAVRPAVYYPIGQFPETLIRYSIVLRSSGDPRQLITAARDQVWRIDRNLPVAHVRTMDDALATAVAQRRFNLVLTGAFSSAALALAALGLYGVLAFAVGQRTREIGVRIALGARAGDVARLIWVHAAKPVLAGMSIGFVGALAASRAIRGLLFGIEGADTQTMLAVAGVVIVAACVASLAPIRRALTIDPVEVLRG